LKPFYEDAGGGLSPSLSGMAAALRHPRGGRAAG
jgi:hypothetical protein